MSKSVFGSTIINKNNINIIFLCVPVNFKKTYLKKIKKMSKNRVPRRFNLELHQDFPLIPVFNQDQE